VRVLDLSRIFPGPLAACILGDLGAEVIKVESPGGDWVRHVPPLGEDGVGLVFRAVNRGKKSLTLNLKAPEGRDVLLRLAERADVLVESYRPGVMERLGLGYEALSAANPCLVYCSLSGYGPSGPYRERAGHDLNFVGLSGLLDMTGPREGQPVLLGAPMADVMGALWATVGILQALLERERTGRGQRVDASLLGGVLSAMAVPVSRSLGGEPMQRGASDLTGGSVCYNVYETADGRYVTLAALEPAFWTAFCAAVGRDDLSGQQYAPALPGEPAYEALRGLFRSRTREEWLATLAGADVCCEPVYTVDEALASAPVKALGMLTAGGLLPAARLSAHPALAAQPAPALGEHTAELLAELGYSAEEVGRLQEQGIVKAGGRRHTQTPYRSRDELETALSQLAELMARDPAFLRASCGLDFAFCIAFSDLDTAFYGVLQNGEVRGGLGRPDEPATFTVVVGSQVFDGVFGGRMSPARAVMRGEFSYSGNTDAAMRFQTLVPDLSRLYKQARSAAARP
jgi:alpha-methylacyl-CoA racemase